MTPHRSLTKRERRIAFLTGIVVASGLLYLYVAEPLWLRWVDLHAQAESLTRKVANFQELVDNRQFIEDNYRRVEGAITVGRDEEELYFNLLQEIAGVTLSARVTLRGMKPLSRKHDDLLDRYGVKLNIQCEGHQLMNLLQALQEPEHMLNIEDLTILAGRGRPPLTVALTVTKLMRTENPV